MSGAFIHHTARPAEQPLDPRKHVNYNMGMILGVDDFNQEFTYLAGRDQWLARDLLGYGTVSGLRVSTGIDHGEPCVLVDAGVALSPRGQLIRVPEAQSAHLNAWLDCQKHHLDTRSLDPAQSNPLKLFIVLAYREHLTNRVPLPTELEQSGQTPREASRVSDDFQLDIHFTAPDQREELALRAFVAWLKQVRSVDTKAQAPKEDVSLASFASAIRKAANLSSSRSTSLRTFMSSPPPRDLYIPFEDAATYWRTAFNLWVTELRPHWQNAPGPDQHPGEQWLFLASLTVQIKKAQEHWRVVIPQDKKEDGKHHQEVGLVDETERPYLLSSRLLQEWMRDEYREIPAADTVSDGTTFGNSVGAGQASSYSRSDHSHGTPTLSGDVITNDDGSIAVQGLQNIPVASGLPEDGQVLMYNAVEEQWQAADLVEINEREDEDEDEDDFVEHPEGAGRYMIVAAGLVRCDGEKEHATYNGLVAHAQPDDRPSGLVLIHFHGYEEPKKSPYIVKVLPKWRGRGKSVLVHFDHFAKHGIMLRITNAAGNSISHAQVRQIELMIEVSHYV